MTGIACAAPRCTDAMVRCVRWLPFCARDAAIAEEHPAAVATLYPPRPPINWAREDAEMAFAEDRAEQRQAA